MWKKEWLCMLIKVNLPILVYSFADRQYFADRLYFYQITKATFAFFKLEFWEICTMLKVLAKWSLMDFFLGV